MHVAGARVGGIGTVRHPRLPVVGPRRFDFAFEVDAFAVELDHVADAPLFRSRFGDRHRRRFVAGVDGDPRDAGEVFVVLDPHRDHPVRAFAFAFARLLLGFGEGQRLRFRAAADLEDAVFVQVPFVGERIAVGIGRFARVDGRFEFVAAVVGPVGRFRFQPRDRRVRAVGDPVDLAFAFAFFAEQARVVEVSVGAFADLHPGIDAALAHEPLGRRGVRFAVLPRQHHPDAAAHRVGEEEGAFVFCRRAEPPRRRRRR